MTETLPERRTAKVLRPDKSPRKARVKAAAKLPAFARALPMALLRSREAVMRYFRPSLRRHHVTEQQWRVLRALNERGAIEVMELAETAVLLPPSLSRILRDLAKRGLILRRSVKNDLRRNVVSISPVGRRMIRSVSPESEAIYVEINRRFGAGRLVELQNTLNELEEVLNAGATDSDATGFSPTGKD